jgi:tetratricopeptide (TPR) repeat protein
MPIRWISLVTIALLVGASCNRDPNVAKRKYLESGNRYFERGKFNEAAIMYRSALKKDAMYGEAYYRLGLTFLKVNNFSGAERSLSRAYRLLKPGPDKADTTTKLADIYLLAYMSDSQRSQKYESLFNEFLNGLPENSFDRLRLEAYKAWRNRDVDGSLAKFEAAKKAKPDDANLDLALAQVLMQKDRNDEAVKLLRDTIARDKTNASAYDVLYQYYMRRNMQAEAEQIRKAKTENNPTVLQYRLQLATHYFLANRLQESERILNAILGDPKTFPEGREKVGDFYLTFRQFDRALETYKGGLNADKAQRLTFLRKIADVYVVQGRRDEALAILDKQVLKEAPNDPVGLALRATLWLETGNRNQLQQAVTELETAVGKLPRNAVVRYNLGRAYWARGDLDLARAQFRAAIDMQPDYMAPRLANIQLHMVKGENAQALQAADEALQLSPRTAFARILRAQALTGLGRLPEARTELQSLLKADPQSMEARFRLGLLELSARNYPAAEQVFRQCLSDPQGEVLCQIGLADVYSAQKQYDKSIALLKEQLAKSPGRRDVMMALANTSVLAERYEQAVDVYKQMLAKEPDSADLNLRLAETQRRIGNIPQAIEGFRRVKQLQPNNPNAAIWLALLLHSTGHEADAKTEYEQILRLQSDNAIALNNLAYLIAEQGGDLDVALTYAQRAKQKAPNSLEVADTLGWIYLKKNLRSNALEIYRDLVVKAPQNPTFRYHHGMALFQQGNRPEARKELEAALRNRPSKDEEGKIRELLQKIG